jgi:hypothetical protein
MKIDKISGEHFDESTKCINLLIDSKSVLMKNSETLERKKEEIQQNIVSTSDYNTFRLTVKAQYLQLKLKLKE